MQVRYADVISCSRFQRQWVDEVGERTQTDIVDSWLDSQNKLRIVTKYFRSERKAKIIRTSATTWSLNKHVECEEISRQLFVFI